MVECKHPQDIDM